MSSSADASKSPPLNKEQEEDEYEQETPMMQTETQNENRFFVAEYASPQFNKSNQGLHL